MAVGRVAGVQLHDVSSPPTVDEVTLLDTDVALDGLQFEWDELLRDSSQANFFLRWHWNRTWWKTYAPSRSRLFLVVCRDERNRLVGLAPFYLGTRRYLGLLAIREVKFLGTGINLKTSEFLDVISRHGYEAVVGEAVAAFLRRTPGWDRLWLWHIPTASTVFRHLRVGLGARARATACDRAPFLEIHEGWDATRAGFGQNLRTNIDRLIRQAFRGTDCRFTYVVTMQELDAAMDDLVRLHRARWQVTGQQGSFAIPHFEAFLREVARHSLAAARLRLWRLTLSGQCVASLLAFVDFGTAHYFQSGFDPASPYKLGRILIGLSIRDCVQSADIRTFDFMGGGAPYKGSWAKNGRDTSELELLRPTAGAALYGMARKVKAWRRNHMGRSFRSRRRRQPSAQL